MTKKEIRTIDFLDEFVEELKKDLLRGEEKWGDTWLHRTKEGQEQRIAQYIADHFDRYKYNDVPVKWESIAGECLIGWIRENYPQFFEEKQ